MDLYATCDRDGTRLIVQRADQPEFNRDGRCYGSDEILMVNKSLEDLPDFPGPGEFKKVVRLSILPLEIEYEAPPFDKIENLISAARTWSANCLSPEEANRYRASDSHLLRAAASLYDAIGLIEASDEPAVKKPRFDDAAVERVMRFLMKEKPHRFTESINDTPEWRQISRDLCTLRDQMNSK